jgi:hypothetical protein
MKRPDGRITYVVGYSGSGKTTVLRELTRASRRLLVWDGKGEWGTAWGCRVVTHPQELVKLIAPGAPPARVSYRVPVSRESFEQFARLAWLYCQAHGGDLLIEELADVTTSSKAPLSWGEICRKSRGFGSNVYAVTQRPQEVDKTVQGNASVTIVGLMPDFLDARYCALRLVSCKPEQVAALKPYQFIQRDARAGQVSAFTIGRTGKQRAMPIPGITPLRK